MSAIYHIWATYEGTVRHRVFLISMTILGYFLSPGGEPLVVTYGFPIWDLSFLNLSRQFFFGFQNHTATGAFFEPRNFLMWRMDGMGWMGWSGNFFFELISRKLLTIFSNLFRILLECVSRYFLRKTQKIEKKSDFSKNFAKIGGWFFFRFF